MKLTKLQEWLKSKGIAARRFNVLTNEEKHKIQDHKAYDIYQSDLIFSPWSSDSKFINYYQTIKPYTLASPMRCWILYSSLRQAAGISGELWECGVFKGGTALLTRVLRDEFAQSKTVRLFDSFIGMPPTDDSKDVHKAGDFADTSFDAVRALVGTDAVEYHAGFIPQTFEGLSVDQIAFAHVDLDLHDAILESCKFIYPRLSIGGVMVFDDYGFPSCPGARIAVDEFFLEKPEFPLVMPSGQCVLVKH
jgi:O-methyltransferase